VGLSYRKIQANRQFKINITSAGPGVSAGIGPARLSAGPRGVNLYGSKYGFRYYQSLNWLFKPLLPAVKVATFLAGIIAAIFVPDLRFPLVVLLAFWLLARVRQKR